MKKTSKKATVSKKTKQRVGEDHPLVGVWEDPEEKFQIAVRYNHPLIGIWQEVENPISETSVIYKVSVRHGRFVVSGLDERPRKKLAISDIRWDGSALFFTSVYPRTGHRAQHELREFKPGLAKHYVTSTSLEFWRKRAPGKRRNRN